jgi:hypothetical protein
LDGRLAVVVKAMMPLMAMSRMMAGVAMVILMTRVTMSRILIVMKYHTYTPRHHTA